jgi:hypothetical protein
MSSSRAPGWCWIEDAALYATALWAAKNGLAGGLSAAVARRHDAAVLRGTAEAVKHPPGRE